MYKDQITEKEINKNCKRVLRSKLSNGRRNILKLGREEGPEATNIDELLV